MIEIMSETEENMLVFRATEKLTAKDYEEVLIPKLEDILTRHDKIKGVVYIPNGFFHGWELGAAWDDAKFGLKHRKDFDKIAIVGGETWLEWITKVGALLITGEVKVYPESEFNTAIDWVKS